MTTLEATDRLPLFKRAKEFLIGEANNLKVIAGLGGIAVMSHQYEALGLSKESEVIPRNIDTSMGHPVLGYAMGLFVDVLNTISPNKKLGDKAYYAAGAALTFGSDVFIETAQSGVQTGFDYNPIANGHIPETVKDLAFAYAGYIGYLAFNKKAAP